MANDKFDELDDNFKSEVSDSAVRARNRTVMLTPEITGKVRARLSRDTELEEQDSGSYNLPGSDSDYSAPQGTIGYESDTQDYSHAENEAAFGSNPSAAETDRSEQSGRHAFNPISRETHKVPPLINKRQPSSENLKNIAPQRRESIPLGYVAPAAERRAVESSLPHINPSANQPSFEDVEAQDTDALVWTKYTPVVGFLVSFDNNPNGEVFFLRSGRVIVSSEIPNGGNYLLIQDESVSPMHGIIRISEDAQVQVLDNLSEYGTTIIRPKTGEEIALSGDKAMVHHGDLLRFGKRSFSVSLIGS